MITYKDSGVDVEAGYESVRLMKDDVKSTFSKNVLGGFGGFGGMYSLKEFFAEASKLKMKEPVLVAGADGAGTKIKLAFKLDKHDTVGIDLVAMSVNDIVCSGAKPLFFLDYIATSKVEPIKIASIVKGIADGCKMAGVSLLGGETAEMPGFYKDGEYDLAGFAVGIVDKANIIDGSKIKEGDVLVGLHSSGVHANGFSLVRRVVGESKEALDVFCTELGATWGEALLKPTRVYVKPVLEVLKKHNAKTQAGREQVIRGIAHITGGGAIENIPRIIPSGLGVELDLSKYPTLPVFTEVVKKAGLTREQAHNTFNMGIGMVLVVEPKSVSAVVKQLESLGEGVSVIGKVVKGAGVKLL